MTPQGWVFLAVSWGAIIALCAFCFYRVFRGHRQRRS